MFSSPAYPSPIFAYIFSAPFWIWILFEVWVFRRERGAARDSSRDRGSAVGVIAFLIIGITLGINLDALTKSFTIRNGFVPIFALGIALVYAGLALRYWSIQTLGRFFRTRVMIQDEHKLITSGPYRFLRNPSYTAILIVL